jgi:hypothetical protein
MLFDSDDYTICKIKICQNSRLRCGIKNWKCEVFSMLLYIFTSVKNDTSGKITNPGADRQWHKN